MSVFPEYVEKIISGEKRFEFRKHTPSENVGFIVFYATAPTAKILCVAEVDEIISDNPARLWRTTALFSGVDQGFYDEYYRGVDMAYAYKLGRVYRLRSPISLSNTNLKISPPQTFRYLTPKQFSYVKKIIEARFLFVQKNNFFRRYPCCWKNDIFKKIFFRKLLLCVRERPYKKSERGDSRGQKGRKSTGKSITTHFRIPKIKISRTSNCS